MLIYAEQNFVSTCTEQPELQDRLMRAKAQQHAEFVLSPWHLYEIGKARPEVADPIINFLERIDPAWIPTRLDLQTVEFAAAWASVLATWG